MKNSLDDTLIAYQKENAYYLDNDISLNWYAKRIIEKYPSNISVLDLGLGHGFTAKQFSAYFTDYTVLDGSEEIIKFFKESNPDTKANIVKTYFENFKTDKRFDLIIMGFILEHVDDPVFIMNHYQQFLKPNSGNEGGLVLSVPNCESMNRRLGYYAGLLEDMSALCENDFLIGHKRTYTVNSMIEDVKKAGLQVKLVEGIFLKPVTTKQLLSLNFERKIYDAMCTLGIQYPELCTAIMLECF
ncbi:type 12 methyltransferase [Spirochaetia bacterium]|nr:type 12 methyltransferase [Spirochaetia bacterium]